MMCMCLKQSFTIVHILPGHIGILRKTMICHPCADDSGAPGDITTHEFRDGSHPQAQSLCQVASACAWQTLRCGVGLTNRQVESNRATQCSVVMRVCVLIPYLSPNRHGSS